MKAAGLIVLVLIVAARVRVTGVVLGLPVNVPVLGIVAFSLVLILAVLVLWLLRNLVRDIPARAVA